MGISEVHSGYLEVQDKQTMDDPFQTVPGSIPGSIPGSCNPELLSQIPGTCM